MLWSQGSPVGNLNGTVLGADGHPMAKIEVLVRTPRGEYQARTDEKGHFILPQLMPGKVKVIVGAADMEEIRMDATVVVGQTTTLNLRLHKPSGVTIEVVAAIQMQTLDTDVAKMGRFMTTEEIDELPLTDDDRVDSVVNRTPGVAANGSYSFNGVDATYNAYNVDGVDVRNPNYGGKTVNLNNYFIDQIQVLTNGISAKYGNFAGGVINVTTKSGTNEFLGTANYEITDPKWNAKTKLSPIQIGQWGMTLSEPLDQHTTVQSYTFTGPIIKDKLFFAWSLRDQTPTTDTHMITSAPEFSGVPYTATSREYRQDAKLEWQINPYNKVYTDWNQSTAKASNAGSNTSNFTSSATLPGVNKTVTGYMSAGWLSILRNDLFMDVKLSQTTVQNGGSGTGPTGGPGVVTWQDTKYSDDYMLLDNGNGTDILTKTQVTSGAWNFTWLLNGMGSHNVDMGIQASKGIKRAAYGTTPSGYEIHFDGFAEYPTPSDGLQERVLVPNQPNKSYLSWNEPIEGTAATSSWSLYANDTWVLNPHWSFNIGARYDRFRFETSPEGNHATYTATVPRLSVNYDLTGTGHHVFSISGGLYAAQPMLGDFAPASVTSSAINRVYAYLGKAGNGSDALLPNGSINWNSWGNLQGQAGQNNPYSVSDPLQNRNVFVDPEVKAPHSKELYLSYRYSGERQNFSAALTRRWTLDQITENGVGNAQTGVATYTLTNSSSDRQDYYALLLTYDARTGDHFSYGGNLTWSRNFSNAGATQQYGTNNFGGQIPTSQLNPYGPTPQQDMPIVVNANAAYKVHLGPGNFNIGTVMTYTGSWVMSFPQGFVFTSPDLVGQGYSPYYMRQFPQLGPIWMASFLKFDLQTGYDLPVWKTAAAFMKFNVLNLFNYRKSEGPFTSTNVVDSTGNPYPTNGSAANVSYAPDPVYQGTPYYFQPGRSLQAVIGLRF
jgi:hypothetical protein